MVMLQDHPSGDSGYDFFCEDIAESGTDLSSLNIWLFEQRGNGIFKDPHRDNGLVPIWKYGFVTKEQWKGERSHHMTIHRKITKQNNHYEVT